VAAWTSAGGRFLLDSRSMSHDLIVIGGGPGGYVAAIRGRQLGLRTALVEREHLGGVCLNWGCIPTKTLLRSAEISHLLRHLDAYGLSAVDVKVDLPAMVARSRAVAAKLAAGVKFLMKKHGVEVFAGTARLDGPGRVVVASDTPVQLAAPHVILATGARARSLPGMEPDGRLLWTARAAMVPERLPASLMIVGAGAIGVEFASFYADLGTAVTLVEALPRILPHEDEEIALLAHQQFARRGIRITVGATVRSLEKGRDDVTAVLDLGGGSLAPLTVDRVIFAVGITGNVDDLGLETTRAQVEQGHVVIDAWSATDEPGLYAIGDVAGPPWLAHKASHEGIVCVERIAGVAGVQPLDVSVIPSCTYSRPQVASVGLSEAAARGGGREVRVGRTAYRANGKALAIGEPDGLVKTIFDAASGELLGAHIVGAEATEMIQGYVIARTLEATEADLMRTVMPHPTLSEMVVESVLDAYGRAVNS